MDVCLLWVSCVLSRRGLCDGPIPPPEESYRLCCVTVCGLEASRMRRPWPALGCCTRGGGRGGEREEEWGGEEEIIAVRIVFTLALDVGERLASPLTHLPHAERSRSNLDGAPEAVWTLWTRQTFFAPAGNRIPVSRLSNPYSLYWMIYPGCLRMCETCTCRITNTDLAQDIHSFTPLSVLRPVHSLFQSGFSTQCDLMLPLSISIILSFS
jgi:hypothetical protein